MFVRTWTDEQLVEAVANNTNFLAVVEALGLSKINHNNTITVKKHIGRLRLSTDHFNPTPGRPPTFTDGQLRTLVPKCRNFNQLATKMGLKRCTRALKRRVEELNLSFFLAHCS